MIDAFGKYQSDNHTSNTVSKVSLENVYLDIGIAVAAFLRKRFEFYTGEIVGRMSFEYCPHSRYHGREGWEVHSSDINSLEAWLWYLSKVASFTGEKLAIAKYNNAVENAYTSSAFEGLAAGMGLGTLQFFTFGSYGLAV
ncbi:hypothetical protein Dimus_015242 [Dionaea muscipula]